MDDRTGQLDVDRRERRARIPQPPAMREPTARIQDFTEVKLPMDPEAAMAEASRCLQCPTPQACVRACPASNDIPRALWYIEHGAFLEAADVFRETSNLPEICSRVCPQVVQCEGSCVQEGYGEGIHIGLLERFVTDYQAQVTGGIPVPEVEPPTGHHVAVIGAGPAGLTVAEELARRGHTVTVYDAWPRAGGTARYGIPSFKLPKDVIDDKVEELEAMGVKFVFNTRVGKDVSLDDLLEGGVDAVFLGTGAGVSAPLKVPGVDLEGVYQATPFLVRANLPEDEVPEYMGGKPDVGRKVAVIGGGDSAMDCLRSSLRLGAEEVTCVYRRTEAQMPGNIKERKNARDEGARFIWLAAPIEIIGDENGHVKAMRCQRMELGEPDSSGRRRPVAIEGDEFTMEVDTVILALGYWPDPLIAETTEGIETHDWGLITADEATGHTSRLPVFAAGDNVHGPDLVVTAMKTAQRAADSIDEYLRTLDD
jgi:glutamate synthase (NADPH/NADH) small chain